MVNAINLSSGMSYVSKKMQELGELVDPNLNTQLGGYKKKTVGLRPA